MMAFSNLLPILGVTILNIILGMLWYSQPLFGRFWAKAHKFDMKKLKPTAWSYVGSILVSLVTVCVISMLIQQFQIMAWMDGMLLGFYLWLGLIVTTQFSGVIWAKKSLRAYFIDICFQLISLEMIGILLTLWQ